MRVCGDTGARAEDTPWQARGRRVRQLCGVRTRKGRESEPRQLVTTEVFVVFFIVCNRQVFFQNNSINAMPVYVFCMCAYVGRREREHET